MSAALATLGLVSPARAQTTEARVGVLRSTGGSTPPELSEAVDSALFRDLAEIAGIPNPIVSPIDLSEIQLNVGCADDGRACLDAMARAAGVSALLVRSLDVTSEGDARLELRYFDSASSDEPRAVRVLLPAHSSDDLVKVVPALVRELFGIPAVAAPAEPAAPAEHVAAHSEPASTGDDGTLLPWIFLGTGAAVLTTGLIVGALASDDFRDWKRRPIRTTSDVERADADFEDLETRAIIADVAMVGGVLAIGLGVTFLMLELDDDESGALEGATLRVEPLSAGLGLRLQGAFREGL